MWLQTAALAWCPDQMRLLRIEEELGSKAGFGIFFAFDESRACFVQAIYAGESFRYPTV